MGTLPTPLQAAAAQGANNIIRYLIQEGADVDEPPASRAGGTALQLATMEGYTCTALLLLEHGADVNAAPSLLEGRTAFGAAADNGRIEMMLLLVQNGVDLLSNDGTQYTRALDFAEKAGQIAARDLVQQLYETAPSNEELRRMFAPDGQDEMVVDESEMFSDWLSFLPEL